MAGGGIHRTRYEFQIGEEKKNNKNNRKKKRLFFFSEMKKMGKKYFSVNRVSSKRMHNI